VIAGGLLVRRKPRIAVIAVVTVSLAEVLVHTPRWYSSVVKSRAYPRTTVAGALQRRGGRLVRLGTVHQSLPVYTPDVPLVDVVVRGPTSVVARRPAGDAVLVPNAGPPSETEMWERVADPAWHSEATAAVVGLGRSVRGAPGLVKRRRHATNRDEWSVNAPGG